VVFLDSVAGIEPTAGALTQKYGGRILAIYTAALRGFALAMDDANAPALAQEPEVCWFEQDAMGHVALTLAETGSRVISPS
jgi:hypothetical protein